MYFTMQDKEWLRLGGKTKITGSDKVKEINYGSGSGRKKSNELGSHVS